MISFNNHGKIFNIFNIIAHAIRQYMGVYLLK